jgi:membrane AbrB-like protein
MPLNQPALSQKSKWARLLLANLVAAGLFYALNIPGALLFGAMAAGIFSARRKESPAIPYAIMPVAMALVGTSSGMMFSPASAASLPSHILPLLATLALTLGAAAFVSWHAAWLIKLPKDAVILGLSPGASAAMTAIAMESGADVAMVGIIQEIRAQLAIGFISAAVYFAGAAHAPLLEAGKAATAPGSALGLLAGIGLTLAGMAFAKIRPFPGAALLAPLGLTAAARVAGIEVYLPDAAPMLVGLLIGWIGGEGIVARGVGATLATLPRIFAAGAVLVLLSAACSFPLVLISGTDPLTAALASVPGGLDVMYGIVDPAKVDMPLIALVQSLRMVAVSICWPFIARKALALSASRDKLQSAPALPPDAS